MNIGYRTSTKNVVFTVEIPKRLIASVRRAANKNCRSFSGEAVVRLHRNIYRSSKAAACPCESAKIRTTIYLPEALLNKVRRRAERERRSTGRELVRLLAA